MEIMQHQEDRLKIAEVKLHVCPCWNVCINRVTSPKSNIKSFFWNIFENEHCCIFFKFSHYLLIARSGTVVLSMPIFWWFLSSRCTVSLWSVWRGVVWPPAGISPQSGVKIHIHLIIANRNPPHKKALQDNIGLDGFALTASIYWCPLCGRFSGGCLSRVAVDGMCHSVFDSMCICVWWLWKYRLATQNDVYLYQVRRYEAKVLVWELSKSFQSVFMCACVVLWFIRWNPPS